jgi:hypothetical protein
MVAAFVTGQLIALPVPADGMGGHDDAAVYRHGVATLVRVERCSFCRRRFYSSEHKCPECGRRSRRGRFRTTVIVLGMALVLALAVKLVYSTANKPTDLPPLPPAADAN